MTEFRIGRLTDWNWKFFFRLVENVQVRRAGFAYRQKYEAFVQRYVWEEDLKICLEFFTSNV